MPNFLVCNGDARVLIRRKVTIAGESLTLVCGYLSMSAVIRAAAYRGGLHMRDERNTNF